MENKINKAILALYGVGLVQIFSLMIAIYWQIDLLKYSDSITAMGRSPIVMIPTLLWTGGVLFGIYKLIPLLRAQVPWAWAVAVALFFLAAPSFALPASVIGLINLLDKDVRTHFLEKLNIKI